MTAASTFSAASLAPTTVGARKRAGRGLVAFGVVGLALLVAAGWFVLGVLGAVGSATAELEGQRDRLVALLPPAEAALDGAAATAENAGSSLLASSAAALSASALVTDLATAMDGMSTAAGVTVFGVQPFAALADELAAVATRSRTLADDLTVTASALDSNVTDSRAAAADLRTLADELSVLRVELERSGAVPTDGASTSNALNLARIVLVGLLLWLAVPAVVAIWLGWRWARD